MDNAAHRISGDHAVDVVRGYADRDAAAVEKALAGLDTDGWIEVHAVLSGLLRSTISIMELTGRRWDPDELVRGSDEVAAAAPPHYELAVARCTRAWARGDHAEMRAVSGQDLPCAVHMTAVGVTVLGLALWGRAGLLAVLREFDETVAALTDEGPSGT